MSCPTRWSSRCSVRRRCLWSKSGGPADSLPPMFRSFRHGRFVLLAAVVATGAGCGFRQHLAVGSMVPILRNATAGARERHDIGMVADALPANILLLDGLIRTEPDNRELL